MKHLAAHAKRTPAAAETTVPPMPDEVWTALETATPERFPYTRLCHEILELLARYGSDEKLVILELLQIQVKAMELGANRWEKG